MALVLVEEGGGGGGGSYCGTCHVNLLDQLESASVQPRGAIGAQESTQGVESVAKSSPSLPEIEM